MKKLATIGEMLAQARYDSGKSQDYVAKALGVNKSTIKNWESGYSAPDCNKCIEWFKAIDRPVVPYILPILYPTMQAEQSDVAVEEALISCIKACSKEQQEKLLFLFLGSHGSSPAGLIEMMAAHLHAPLRGRLNVCSSIITNYEVSESLGELVQPEKATSNIEALKAALAAAQQAVKESKTGY